jgi:hypothetical protein
MAVEIPNPNGGGTRILGMPTISDGVAQTVVANEVGGEGRTDLSPRLLWLPTVLVGVGRGGGMSGAVLEDRLGDRFGHPKVLRQHRSHSHGQGGAGSRRRSVGGVLYVKRWLTAPMQLPDGTLQERDRGTPQGSAVSPLVATCSCTMRSTPGVPDYPVRALRRRRGRALCDRTPSPQSGRGDRGQDGTGRAATAPRSRRVTPISGLLDLSRYRDYPDFACVVWGIDCGAGRLGAVGGGDIGIFRGFRGRRAGCRAAGSARVCRWVVWYGPGRVL